MAEYKVTLQDDTVKKLKNIVGIGITDEEYLITDNGVVDVDSFIDHTKIKVDINDKNVHLEDTDNPLLITTNGEQIIVREETEDNITTYTGHKAVNVSVALDQVTSEDHITALINGGTLGQNASVDIKVESKDRENPTAIFKNIPFTIFKDDERQGIPAINLTREDCIIHYGIDEVSNYTGYEDVQLDDIEESGDDIFMFHIQGKIGTDEERTYPYDTAKFGGYIAISKTKLAELGYELKELDQTEGE